MKPRGAQILYDGAWYLRVLSMELAAGHLSGGWNLVVGPNFFLICTPLVKTITSINECTVYLNNMNIKSKRQ